MHIYIFGFIHEHVRVYKSIHKYANKSTHYVSEWKWFSFCDFNSYVKMDSSKEI